MIGRAIDDFLHWVYEQKQHASGSRSTDPAEFLPPGFEPTVALPRYSPPSDHGGAVGGKGGAFDSGHASRWDWSTSSNPPNVIAGHGTWTDWDAPVAPIQQGQRSWVDRNATVDTYPRLQPRPRVQKSASAMKREQKQKERRSLEVSLWLQLDDHVPGISTGGHGGRVRNLRSGRTKEQLLNATIELVSAAIHGERCLLALNPCPDVGIMIIELSSMRVVHTSQALNDIGMWWSPKLEGEFLHHVLHWEDLPHFRAFSNSVLASHDRRISGASTEEVAGMSINARFLYHPGPASRYPEWLLAASRPVKMILSSIIDNRREVDGKDVSLVRGCFVVGLHGRMESDFMPYVAKLKDKILQKWLNVNYVVDYARMDPSMADISTVLFAWLNGFPSVDPKEKSFSGSGGMLKSLLVRAISATCWALSFACRNVTGSFRFIYDDEKLEKETRSTREAIFFVVDPAVPETSTVVGYMVVQRRDNNIVSQPTLRGKFSWGEQYYSITVPMPWYDGKKCDLLFLEGDLDRHQSAGTFQVPNYVSGDSMHESVNLDAKLSNSKSFVYVAT